MMRGYTCVFRGEPGLLCFGTCAGLLCVTSGDDGGRLPLLVSPFVDDALVNSFTSLNLSINCKEKSTNYTIHHFLYMSPQFSKLILAVLVIFRR